MKNGKTAMNYYLLTSNRYKYSVFLVYEENAYFILTDWAWK